MYSRSVQNRELITRVDLQGKKHGKWQIRKSQTTATIPLLFLSTSRLLLWLNCEFPVTEEGREGISRCGDIFCKHVTSRVLHREIKRDAQRISAMRVSGKRERRTPRVKERTVRIIRVTGSVGSKSSPEDKNSSRDGEREFIAVDTLPSEENPLTLQHEMCVRVYVCVYTYFSIFICFHTWNLSFFISGAPYFSY